MRFYHIYEHPHWGRRAVAHGFSWPAFLAPPAWAAAKGLGPLTLGLVVASTLLFDAFELVARWIAQPAALATLLVAGYTAFGLHPGARATRWHAERLRIDGFELRCTVVAEDVSHALSALADRPLRRAGRTPLVLLTYGAQRFPEKAFAS